MCWQTQVIYNAERLSVRYWLTLHRIVRVMAVFQIRSSRNLSYTRSLCRGLIVMTPCDQFWQTIRQQLFTSLPQSLRMPSIR